MLLLIWVLLTVQARQLLHQDLQRNTLYLLPPLEDVQGTALHILCV